MDPTLNLYILDDDVGIGLTFVAKSTGRHFSERAKPSQHNVVITDTPDDGVKRRFIFPVMESFRAKL